MSRRDLRVPLAAMILATFVGSLFAQDRATIRAPFPANAAGWGPSAGDGRYYSRWAEDWTAARVNGDAPFGKAMPLGAGAFLTLSGELRLRANRYDNARLRRGDDYGEDLLRGVLGADLQLHPQLRAYGEIATGQVLDGAGALPANFENDAAISQAFVEARGGVGGLLVGAMVGRQEFADGPRQLVSLGDGPNLHRTWNGVRLYGHGEDLRLGAFEFAATRLGEGAFDEGVDGDERLRGANAGIVLARDARGASACLDPFWLHSEIPEVRLVGAAQDDRRDTLGARLCGNTSHFTFDVTAAHQHGHHGDRDVDAWALFASQSLLLDGGAWQPRLTLHVDVASGGGASGTGTVRTFHQLYASSGYLGEGRFLSLSNLVLCAPGIAVAPLPQTRLSVEYGFAWRFAEDDAVYGGGMRAYPRTSDVDGKEIGGLLRVEARWSGPTHLGVVLGYEHLEARDALDRAGLSDGDYAYVSLTVRY